MTARARVGHFHMEHTVPQLCRQPGLCMQAHTPEITKLPRLHSKLVRNCGVAESKVKPEPISSAKQLPSQSLISSPVHWPRPKASDRLTVCTEQNCLCFQITQKCNQE